MAEIQTFSDVVITTEGLKLLAAIQVGDTMTLTRAAIGDGYLDDDADGTELTALVSEVASQQTGDDGTLPTVDISKMTVDGSTAQVTVTIQNGDTSFYLRELGLFAADADGNEILYAYTNAGDGAYPIPATTSGSITRILVLGTTVSSAADITANITYAGEVTAEDLAAATPFAVDTVITADAWTATDDDEYIYTADVEIDGVSDTLVPIVSVDTASYTVAENAGLCPIASTSDGYVTFRAAAIPEDDISVSIVFIKTGGSTSSGTSSGTYTLPIASASTLGGVKIGDGISVSDDGTISVDTAEITETVATDVIENVSATDEEAREAISDVMDT